MTHYAPDYGQPWNPEQLVKNGCWVIRNCVGRVVAGDIDTHGQAVHICEVVNDFYAASSSKRPQDAAPPPKLGGE